MEHHETPNLEYDVVRQLKAFTRSVMRECESIIRQYFRQVSVEEKEDGTPVTIADREVEELIRKRINGEFPGHGIVGEEFGDEAGSEPFTWVFDPIDGTKSLVSGAFDFGTQFALLHHEQPVFGAVFQPIMNDLCMP